MMSGRKVFRWIHSVLVVLDPSPMCRAHLCSSGTLQGAWRLDGKACDTEQAQLGCRSREAHCCGQVFNLDFRIAGDRSGLLNCQG